VAPPPGHSPIPAVALSPGSDAFPPPPSPAPPPPPATAMSAPADATAVAPPPALEAEELLAPPAAPNTPEKGRLGSAQKLTLKRAPPPPGAPAPPYDCALLVPPPPPPVSVRVTVQGLAGA
jgi:hypothetical protein